MQSLQLSSSAPGKQPALSPHLQSLCEDPAPWPATALNHHHLVAMVGQLASSRQACRSHTHIHSGSSAAAILLSG
jgi:hypothetical protein